MIAAGNGPTVVTVNPSCHAAKGECHRTADTVEVYVAAHLPPTPQRVDAETFVRGLAAQLRSPVPSVFACYDSGRDNCLSRNPLAHSAAQYVCMRFEYESFYDCPGLPAETVRREFCFSIPHSAH